MKAYALSDPELWVDRYGDALYQYSLIRLRDPDLAKDVVQETFLAALEARHRFAGESSERTWLFGILKHKIIDSIRRRSSEHPLPDVETIADATERFFDESGRWISGPGELVLNPSDAYEQTQFWEILNRCLSGLPTRLVDAFTLREIDGLDTEEICKLLDISSTNLWVMLHRARLRLRHCLEAHGLRPENT